MSNEPIILMYFKCHSLYDFEVFEDHIYNLSLYELENLLVIMVSLIVMDDKLLTVFLCYPKQILRIKTLHGVIK